MRISTVAVIALLALGAGCGTSAAERELAEPRETWEAQDLERYVVDVETGGSGPFRVTVMDGKVHSVRVAPDAAGDVTLPTRPPPTVEELFERIDVMLEQGADVGAQYDPGTGLPANVAIVDPATHRVAVYLRSDDTIERWPLDPTPVLCE